MISSEPGCRCSGVVLPRARVSSNTPTVPFVCSALTFQVWTPPPLNQSFSPSPACRTIVLMVLWYHEGTLVPSKSHGHRRDLPRQNAAEAPHAKRPRRRRATAHRRGQVAHRRGSRGERGDFTHHGV